MWATYRSLFGVASPTTSAQTMLCAPAAALEGRLGRERGVVDAEPRRETRHVRLLHHIVV